MFTLKRLVLVAVVSFGLSVAASPAGAAETADPTTAVSTTTEGAADAGIQSAGLASRAPGTKCGKKATRHGAAAQEALRAAARSPLTPRPARRAADHRGEVLRLGGSHAPRERGAWNSHARVPGCIM